MVFCLGNKKKKYTQNWVDPSARTAALSWPHFELELWSSFHFFVFTFAFLPFIGKTRTRLLPNSLRFPFRQKYWEFCIKTHSQIGLWPVLSHKPDEQTL